MNRSLVLLFGLAAAACGGQPAPPGASPSPAAASPTEAKTYDIRGRVESLDHARMSVTLDHEAIPGLMPAMKMEYKVVPHTLLEALAPGSAVEGRLEARGTDYTIVALKKR